MIPRHRNILDGTGSFQTTGTRSRLCCTWVSSSRRPSASWATFWPQWLQLNSSLKANWHSRLLRTYRCAQWVYPSLKPNTMVWNFSSFEFSSFPTNVSEAFNLHVPKDRWENLQVQKFRRFKAWYKLAPIVQIQQRIVFHFSYLLNIKYNF